MEVHPPEHPVRSWRDFFVHIATIVVGLLIAIALEQSVEALHRRHLLHQAEAKLRDELLANRELLRMDREQIEVLRTDLNSDVTLLQAQQEHTPGQGSMHLSFDWSSMNATAWDTARDSGAVALMPYDAAQTQDDLYRQATLVNAQAAVVIRDMFQCTAPVQGGHTLENARPADVDSMLATLRQTLVDLKFLQMLVDNLETKYRAGHADE